MNCWNCVDLKENAYGEKLGLGSTTTQFESESLGENEHLLNGRVGGTPADVIDFVRKFSGELGKAGIAHHFEVYSAQEERLVEFPLRAHL